MNFCHDCHSSYSTPGTCNCFAFGGKRYPQIVTTGGSDTVAPPAQPPVITLTPPIDGPTWVQLPADFTGETVSVFFRCALANRPTGSLT